MTRLLENLARVFLGRIGVKVGPRRLGRCAECYCFVWDDDKRVRIHGVWFHRDCARYVRREAA